MNCQRSVGRGWWLGVIDNVERDPRWSDISIGRCPLEVAIDAEAGAVGQLVRREANDSLFRITRRQK